MMRLGLLINLAVSLTKVASLGLANKPWVFFASLAPLRE